MLGALTTNLLMLEAFREGKRKRDEGGDRGLFIGEGDVARGLGFDGGGIDRRPEIEPCRRRSFEPEVADDWWDQGVRERVKGGVPIRDWGGNGLQAASRLGPFGCPAALLLFFVLSFSIFPICFKSCSKQIQSHSN
jgi:hypothetical protein